MCVSSLFLFSFFFFNDTATTEIYTLSYTTLFRSLHGREGEATVDEYQGARVGRVDHHRVHARRRDRIVEPDVGDRKSTRLNSSHDQISYAVFCLKKKKKK